MPAVSDSPVAVPPKPSSGSKSQTECRHCGTPFKPTPERAEFCCAGCQFVHGLITANGLTQFYDLQGGALPPVKSVVFEKRDFAWLEEQAAQSNGELTLDVQGLSCVGCVWLIERVFGQRPGALTIRVDAALGSVEMRFAPGQFDVTGFAHDLQRFGYLLGPRGSAARQRDRSLTIQLGLCGALAMNAMLFTLPTYFGMATGTALSALFAKVSFFCGTLSFLIGGTFFFRRAWQSLRHGILHIDLPISLGLVAAYAGSIYAWQVGAQGFVYFDFVSTFTFLMLVGRWTQQSAIERNRNRLLQRANDAFSVVALPSEEKVPASVIEPRQRYRLAPGQAAPVRSKLLSEAAAFGLEWINGESEARSSRMGQIAPAGAVLCSQRPVELEALESWNESLLAKLVRADSRKSTEDQRTQRFIRGYLAAVLVMAAAGFVYWMRAGDSLLAALQVLISVLVVSCPCASGVALPLTDEMAVSGLRKRGVFIREHAIWARLRRVKKIVFDKTGTLTLETMAIRNPGALDGLTPGQKAVLLQMVEDNLHPVSCCLREHLMAARVEPARLGTVVETVGSGLELIHGDHVWRLGRPGWAGRDGRGENGECDFTCDGMLLARFSFHERVRPDAAEEVARLQTAGYEVYILSGDRSHKVAAMARQLGLSEERWRAEVSPAQKAEWLQEIGAADAMMIGDGANDSLAFDESLCTGTPAIDRGLLEQKADFYFLGRGLSGVRQLLETARRRAHTVHRVLAFTISYNVVVITLALTGRMSPLLAAVLMPASSLVSLGIVLAHRLNRAPR